MKRIEAIKEKYKGIWFKSRLEKSWAEYFDSLNIIWSYEPEGFKLNCGWYLPDFYLPEIETVVEVKGIMDLESLCKIQEFSKEKFLILAMAPVGQNYFYVKKSGEFSAEVLLVKCTIPCSLWHFKTFDSPKCPSCKKTEISDINLSSFWIHQQSRRKLLFDTRIKLADELNEKVQIASLKLAELNKIITEREEYRGEIIVPKIKPKRDAEEDRVLLEFYEKNKVRARQLGFIKDKGVANNSRKDGE